MAEEPRRSKCIPTQIARRGLYIWALDRPWVETPLLFQGFKIQTDFELQVLRDYCNHVHVDLDESDPEVVADLLSLGPVVQRNQNESDRTAEMLRSAPSAPSIDSPLFDTSPVVDRERFEERVKVAVGRRRRLYRAAVRAIKSVVDNKNIESRETQGAVRDMSAIIEDDPTASLWLTRIRGGNDYVSRHAVNSCVMALTFGRYLGLEGRPLHNIGVGTLLMDVGRMIVPGHVFPKKGPLSDDDWAYVRRHVTDGVRLLNNSNVPDDSLDIVRMHHERCLGQGYPNGLVADVIPWTALVGGLVDSYDAMLHDRPYRRAYRGDEAMGTLYGEARETFGSDLVEAFIRYLGNFPVGTVVELDNGAVGVVVGSNPAAALWPTVLLVRGAEGERFERRVLVNLSAARDAPASANVPGRYIRRTLSAQEADIPVEHIVASEFGLKEAS